MSKYKLVTFDVTNTFLRFRLSVGHQYSKAASAYGVHGSDPDRLTASFRTSWKQLASERPNFGRQSTGSQKWWMELVRKTFAGAGQPLESDRLNAIASHLIAVYGTDACWTVVPGTLDTLKALKTKNPSPILGVISNFDDRLYEVLRHVGLSQYFDFVIDSYGAGFAKPHPAIFEVALVEASRRRPEVGVRGPRDALHVGNDVQLDYFGARSAGWNALLVSGEGDVPVGALDPRTVIGRLTDVLAYVDDGNKD